MLCTEHLVEPELDLLYTCIVQLGSKVICILLFADYLLIRPRLHVTGTCQNMCMADS